MICLSHSLRDRRLKGKGTGVLGKGGLGAREKLPFPKLSFPSLLNACRAGYLSGLGLGGEDSGNEFRRFSSLSSTQLSALYCIQVFVFLMFYFIQKFRPFSFKSTMIQLKRIMKEGIGQLVCGFTVRHGLCEYLHIDHVQGGGILPYKRLMGMCRWMGTNFHDWIDYNVVAFSIALLDITRMGPKCPPPFNPGPCAFSLFCLLFVCTPNFPRNGSKLHILGL